MRAVPIAGVGRRIDGAVQCAFLGGIPHGDIVEQADSKIHCAGQQDQQDGQADRQLDQALSILNRWKGKRLFIHGNWRASDESSAGH